MESSVTTSGTTAAGVVEHCTLASRRMAPGGQAGPCAGQFFLRRSHPSTCQHHCHDCNGPTRSCPMKAKRRRRGGGSNPQLCVVERSSKREGSRRRVRYSVFHWPPFLVLLHCTISTRHHRRFHVLHHTGKERMPKSFRMVIWPKKSWR